MKRLHSSDKFGSGDVKSDETTSGIFHVKSVDSVYEVNFGSDTEYPYCTCEDFKQHFLPCKHFFCCFPEYGSQLEQPICIIYRQPISQRRL